MVHRSGNNHTSYTITAPLRSIHPLLPIRRWWSYSTIQCPSLPDQEAHIGKVACLRLQETAVSWAQTPAVRVTVEYAAVPPIINQSINQTSITPISPVKPGSVARQPNQCSTAKSRKQFRNINLYLLTFNILHKKQPAYLHSMIISHQPHPTHRDITKESVCQSVWPRPT